MESEELDQSCICAEDENMWVTVKLEVQGRMKWRNPRLALYCIVPLPNVNDPLETRTCPNYKETVRVFKMTYRIY